MRKKIFGTSSIIAISFTVLLAACGEESNSGAQDEDTSRDEINVESPNVNALTCSEENEGVVAATIDDGDRKCQNGLWVNISASEPKETISSSSPSTASPQGGDAKSSSSYVESSSTQEEHSSSSQNGSEVIYECDDGVFAVDDENCYSSANESSSSDVKTESDASSSSSEESSSSSEISSSSNASSSSSEESSSMELSEACKTMRATNDQFIPLENVFECILPNEKIVFLIRHAERDKDDKIGTKDLNDNGRSQAIYLGEKLASLNLEDFHYMSTSINRTMSTAILISRGKGESVLDSLAVTANESSNHFIKSDDFVESWFQKDKSIDNCAGIKSWAKFTKMAYEPNACTDAFYNVDAKVNEIVEKHFIYNNINRYNMVISHDQFLAPFLISVTDRKIGLNAHDYVYPDGNYNDWNQNVFKHWPNYLTGAAIIINEKNERVYIPVKGLKNGYLGYHCRDEEDEGYSCKIWEKGVN